MRRSHDEHASPFDSARALWYHACIAQETPASSLPIVFLGPCLPRPEAERLLKADYRPPIRRGDLEQTPPGAVVAIIDGVFDQNLSISPREVRQAVERGVRIYGSSSMGALRATEVPGVTGVGRVYQMYRDGGIESDDEVALVFDPESYKTLSEPLVNIRHAAACLLDAGSINADIAKRILTAAKDLHYTDRSYRRILARAGLADRKDADQLLSALRSYDLKREDAIVLLERLSKGATAPAEPAAPAPSAPAPKGEHRDSMTSARWLKTRPADAPVLFWEYGESVSFGELVSFLKLTGVYSSYARAALGRMGLAGRPMPAADEQDSAESAALYFQDLRSFWDLKTPDEARVTFNDLGLGQTELEQGISDEIQARRAVRATGASPSEPFLHALRAELFMSDLALKRETIRLGSLRLLARESRKLARPLEEDELSQARAKVCETSDAVDWPTALEILAQWGVAAAEAEAFVDELAHARRAARAFLPRRARAGAPSAKARARGWTLKRSLKVPGDRRFCLTLSAAYAATRTLRKTVSITRVGDITKLSPLRIPIVQAFRPSGGWSSTVGSGKSSSLVGAKVGAVMEEIEKWAQERFASADWGPEIKASYEQMRRRAPTVDPAELDLPYDTRYREDLAIGWSRCHDFISGGPVYVPSASVLMRRQPDDIYYSARLGQKVFRTNGLASGFTLEEALCHAVCELIERHARKVADLTTGNPGVKTPPAYRFVDLSTAPASTRALLKKTQAAGYRMRVLDITCEVPVPVFLATLLKDYPSGCAYFGADTQVARGWGAHPDPEIALNAAFLEAVQTIVGGIAGSREDLTMIARSLGRHQGTLAKTRSRQAFEHTIDPPLKPFQAIRGFEARDVADEIRWVIEGLRAVGARRLLAVDLSRPEIRPVRVVRALLPGFDGTNPLHTGLRCRAALLPDLLPTSA